MLTNYLLTKDYTNIQSKFFICRLIWILFVLFTSLHLFANYRAVSAVKMETFNQARLHLVISHYLGTRNREILPVKDANLQEPLIFSKYYNE